MPLTPDKELQVVCFSFPLHSQYYFSEENLMRDFFLRRKMTKEGWIPINLISTFNRVKNLTMDVQVIIDVSGHRNLCLVSGCMYTGNSRQSAHNSDHTVHYVDFLSRMLWHPTTGKLKGAVIRLDLQGPRQNCNNAIGRNKAATIPENVTGMMHSCDDTFHSHFKVKIKEWSLLAAVPKLIDYLYLLYYFI